VEDSRSKDVVDVKTVRQCVDTRIADQTSLPPTGGAGGKWSQVEPGTLAPDQSENQNIVGCFVVAKVLKNKPT